VLCEECSSVLVQSTPRLAYIVLALL